MRLDGNPQNPDPYNFNSLSYNIKIIYKNGQYNISRSYVNCMFWNLLVLVQPWFMSWSVAKICKCLVLKIFILNLFSYSDLNRKWVVVYTEVFFFFFFSEHYHNCLKTLGGKFFIYYVLIYLFIEIKTFLLFAHIQFVVEIWFYFRA